MRTKADVCQSLRICWLDDALAELDVGLKVEALGAELEVAQDLVLLRIALGPVPFLQQVLVERVTVDVAVRVAARAGIAIPVPPASNTMTFRSSLSRSECSMYIPENPAPMMTASKSKKVT